MSIIKYAHEINAEAKEDEKFYTHSRKRADLAAFAVGWMDSMLEDERTTLEDVKTFHAAYKQAREVLKHGIS